MDARGGHPDAARNARPATPGGPAAKSARTAPDPDGRQQLDSPRPAAEARGPAESDSATAPTSGPPRVSSPAKRRQDQFRELALKRLGTANSMTPRLRRQLVADGTGMGLSSEEINSVLFSLPRTTPPVPPHAVPAAPAQPAGTSPPVAGPAAHTPADPPLAAPPVAPPPSDADSAKEKPKTPPAEIFGKWVTEQLARLATDVLTADDEASLVGVGIHRFRLARVLATHVLRDAAEDRGMRLERDLNDASCHSTADASAQGSSAAEDDRLKEFFDQAAPILAMHRGINAQSRVMLNAIAERLGLSPEDLDRAIMALQRSPVDADEDDPRQIERREAYRGYLRRAIAQLPDAILTFKMERRLIEAGEHFHGVTPKWIKPTINEVASETGARFISEKQASDHIASLVDDLLQRSTWVDATKRNRVYAEGTRWGLDPPDIEAIIRQRIELKKKDIAADRRRTRWLLMAVPVVAGLAVGLVLWMSLRAGQNDTVAAAQASQSTGPPVPKTQTPPATDWWDDDLRIAAVRLRVAHPVLKPLLEDCQDKDPTVRASSYKQLIGNHAGTPADEEDQESLRTLLTGLYALDPVDFAAHGIPESLVGGLDSLDDRLPAGADELALMYWKCRTAVLMLKHPKLPTERSAELVKLIESALNCAPDRLLDAEPLQRECLGALTRRLYDVLTKAASKDPQLAAALHVALASEAVDCLDDATMERLDMEFLDAILPALGTDWTKQHELIGRMAHADEPSVVLKMLEIYEASTDDSLRGYLVHLFVDRLKLTEDDIASMTEQELLDRVRKGLGVAASGERPAGWQGLADDAKALLAATVPETDAKAVLGHTVGLARLATMACALAHADAGRATFERLQTAGPIELEDESAPWSTTSPRHDRASVVPVHDDDRPERPPAVDAEHHTRYAHPTAAAHRQPRPGSNRYPGRDGSGAGRVSDPHQTGRARARADDAFRRATRHLERRASGTCRSTRQDRRARFATPGRLLDGGRNGGPAG